MEVGDFEQASMHYKHALDFIDNSPANAATRQETKTGHPEALYQEARTAAFKGDKAWARELALKAKEYGNPKAGNMIERLGK